MMSFLDFLNKKVDIDIEIEKILSGDEEIISALREFSLRGGKRFRGLLVLIGYSIFGGKKDRLMDMVSVACVVELLHAMLLVHDDIMDKSDLRRGKATLHEIFEKKYAGKGKDLAMLSGDQLFFRFFNYISNLNLSDGEKMIVFKEISKTGESTCYGQYLDLVLDNPSEDEILELYRLKTGVYSIVNPLKLGALLAGADSKFFKEIEDFALPLGLAFQIQDDLLDLFSLDSGKGIYRDLKEGKITFPIRYALDNSDRVDEIRVALGNIYLSPSEGKVVSNIVLECGAKSYSENRIKELFKKSLSALEGSSLPGKVILRDFLNFILARKN